MTSRIPHPIAIGSSAKRDGVYAWQAGNTHFTSLEFVENNRSDYYLLALQQHDAYLMQKAIRRQNDLVQRLESDIATTSAENALLKEEVARLKREIFGTSSEKSVDPKPEPTPVPDEPVMQEQAQAGQSAKKSARQWRR